MKPIVFSKIRRSSPRKREFNEYVLNWIRNPDPQGGFSKKVGAFKRLPRSLVIPLMRLAGYDGIIFMSKGSIVGNIFFQRHGNSLHLFAIYITPKLRRKGLAREAVEHFVRHAKTVKGIERVRIGGEKLVGRVLCARLKKSEKRLGIKVEKGGWVKLMQSPNKSRTI